MTKYIVSRTLQAIIVLIGVTLVTFVLVNVVPGDPVLLMLDKRADPDTIARIRTELGFDRPYHEQYLRFFSKAIRGDFGNSYFEKTPVVDMIVRSLRHTVKVASQAFVLALVVGLTLGILSAAKHNSVIDRLIMFLSTLSISAPSFWIAVLLQILFGVKWKMLPLSGVDKPGSLILPVITLGIAHSAAIARIIHTGTLQETPSTELAVPGVCQLDPVKVLGWAKELEGNFASLQTEISSRLGVWSRYQHPEYPELTFWVQRQVKYPVDFMVHEGEFIGCVQQNREHTTLLVREGWEERTPLRPWLQEDISQPTYAIEFAGDFSVPMDDGVELATSVWLPQAEGPFPVILIRTPYGRKRLAAEELRYVRRGYALVAQDVRGREDSAGEWLPFAYEAADGAATLNWIAAQEWCSGRIGMTGASYGGFVQWAAASTGNPYLKALVSIVTAGSPFGDIPRKGGTFMSGLLPWCFAMAEQRVNPAAMQREDWDQVLRHRPLKDTPQLALDRELPFWSTWAQNPDYNRFWQRQDWPRQADQINVPALIISGWCDDNITGSLEAWEVLASPGKASARLIMGPWPHDLNTARDLHGVAYGNDSLYYNIDLVHLQWFDRFLKGRANGVEQPWVEYYVLGENRWEAATSWPPPGAEKQCLFFAPEGELAVQPEAEPGYRKYVYDPNEPAPHLLELTENELNVPGNYKEVEQRQDVVTFTSPVLQEAVEIAGPVQAVFYASSSAPDTDFIVRLLDVDPEGNSIKLA